MKNLKKLLSICLVLALLCTMLPLTGGTTVFAAKGDSYSLTYCD